jgi:hypothetical protein
MTYPEIIRRGFFIWWRTRALWLLGVLAALVGASDYSTGNVNLNLPSNSVEESLPSDMLERIEENPLLQAFLINPLPFVVGAVAVALLLLLISLLLGQLFHGAMIRMVDVVDQGYAPALGDAFRVAAARLMPLFGLALLLALPVVLLVAVILAIAVGIVFQIQQIQANAGDDPAILGVVGGALLCVVPLVLLMLVLGVVLNVFARVAQRVCVIEGRGPLQSLGRAWQLMRRNIGNTLLNWLALAILGGVVGVITAIPAVAISVPIIFSLARGDSFPWAALGLLFVYGIVVAVLLGGWLTSFNSAVWTVLYRSYLAREQPTVPESYAPGD